MQLTNEKELKRFIKLLNDINQLLKNIKSSSEYIIVKGKCICYPEPHVGDLGVLRLDPFDNGKKDNVSEYLNNLTGKINGTELYNFLSENKKDITEIILEKSSFIIKTSNNNEFKSESINNKDFNYKSFVNFTSGRDFKTKKLLDSCVFTEEMKDDFSDISFPSLQIGEYNLRITPKLFIKINSSVDIAVNIYDYNEELNMIEVITENPKLYSCKQYFLYIK